MRKTKQQYSEYSKFISISKFLDENDTYTNELAFTRKDIGRLELIESGENETGSSSMDDFPEDLFTGN